MILISKVYFFSSTVSTLDFIMVYISKNKSIEEREIGDCWLIDEKRNYVSGQPVRTTYSGSTLADFNY